MGNNQSIDLDAAHYEKNSKIQHTYARELVSQLSIKATDSILDVGCGVGEVIARISKTAPLGKSVGIDLSSNMINLAIKKFPAKSFPKLEFHVMNAEEILLPPCTFDHIICTSTLLWVRSPKTALQSMFHLLKPGADLALLNCLGNTPYTQLFEKVTKKHYPHLVDQLATKTMMSESEHKKALISAGFSLNLFNATDEVFKYKDETDFANYVKGWLPCLLPIQQDEQDKFIELVTQELLSGNAYKNGKELVIPYKMLRVLAAKPC